MFPYPSGRLHMGHVRVYTISDTFAHFYRMNGYHVVHPMGWDAFGLPAENAARDRNVDPRDWTRDNILYMKDQFRDLNLMFDWDKEVLTCDPEYYKWTQYLFVKLFEAGLVYQKDAVVNWDPIDKTVLADEQVDENGCSWRSGATVEQKYMKQWFFKTSDYSESLLETLHEVDEHYGIKAMQRNWIGNIDGSYFDFYMVVEEASVEFPMTVFCPFPEAAEESSHVVLQSKFKGEVAYRLKDCGDENIKILLMEKRTQDYTLSGCYVINPFSKKRLPVIISNKYEDKYLNATAILSCPCADEIAESTAKYFNLDYSCSPKHVARKRDDILAQSKLLGIGSGKMTSSKLRDWLISRQRYWGTPIPIIHCPHHGPVTVPVNELPVKLPDEGTSLLATHPVWAKATCPKCGSPAKRETDTMDTFVDSSWYFLRYTDSRNAKSPFSKENADKIMPVDLYIGGKEHAILHLYFARFINHFLVDQGSHSHKEPFKKLVAQGIIKGITHQVQSTGKYISADDVDYSGKLPLTRDTRETVKMSFQKMSKSKLNGVDPKKFVDEWGISITRLYVLYAAAPSEDICWDIKTDIIPGVMRWQLKLWTCVTRILDARNLVAQTSAIKENCDVEYLQEEYELFRSTNEAIGEITGHYANDCVLSAAITNMMVLAKTLFHASDYAIKHSPEFERGLCSLVIMSAPMVPHFASELWSGLQLMKYKLTNQNWDGDVLMQPWPMPATNSLPGVADYRIEVDGNACCSIKLPANIVENIRVKSAILKNKKVKKYLRDSGPGSFVIDKENFVIRLSSN